MQNLQQELDPKALLDDFAREYYEQQKNYQNSVCTGPIIDGCSSPANVPEQGLVTQFERFLFKELTKKTISYGLRQGDLRIALMNYRHAPPPIAL